MSQKNLEKTADLSYFTDKSGENGRPVICHRKIWRKLQTCHMSQTNLEKKIPYTVEVLTFASFNFHCFVTTTLCLNLSVTYDRSAVFSRFVCDI
jgi:hypothetical protein